METKSIYPAELVLLLIGIIAGLYVLAVLVSPQYPDNGSANRGVAAPKFAALPPLIPAPLPLPPIARNTPGRFRVVALPDGFTACGINSKGEVGGTWLGDPVGGLRSAETRAALWRNGKFRVFSAWNNEPSYGSALSDASVVAGSAGSSWSGAYLTTEGDAVLWKAAAKNPAPRLLGHLPKLSCATLHAINRRGQAVGASGPSSFFESKDDTQRENAFLWDGRSLLNLGSGTAYGINERGQVAGTSENQIALWQEREKRLLGQGEGRAINNRGQIAGISTFGRTRTEAVPDPPRRNQNGAIDLKYQRYHLPLNHAMLWERGVMKDLGVLPGTVESEAVGINDRRQIVGNCTDTFDYKKQRAFLWQGSAMADLNARIPERGGWILREARSINNRGQIVGVGALNGKERSFLLTPP